MPARTRAQIDALVDAHHICPLCLSDFRIQPRRDDEDTTSPVRICTGNRDDRCDFWQYIREGEPGWTPQPTCATCGEGLYGTQSIDWNRKGQTVHTVCPRDRGPIRPALLRIR